MRSAVRPRIAGRAASAALGLLVALLPVAPPTGAQATGPEDGPVIRVGVAVDRQSVTLSSPRGLRLEDALTGQPAGEVAAGGTIVAGAAGSVLDLGGDLERAPEGVPSIRVFPARNGDPLYISGRPFRGTAEVRVVGPERVSAINVLPLEDYLLGVVPLEIGERQPEELAAVEAQAVAARTYAVAQLGGHHEMGFDLYGSVDDQVYGGLAAERDETTLAVRSTAGEILLFDGRPIRAYYHSTCGGVTAAIEEVLDREPAPYLRSVSDRAPDGTDYCAASPRYSWSVRWSEDELDSVSRSVLAEYFRVAPSELGPIRSIEIRSRTPSGRVRDLAFRGAGLDLVLSRLDIRRALSHDGRILNSTDFDVIEGSGGLVEVRGRGYGHGAGMCQWGAIGRARAGQDYAEILATYYPGADLVRAYGREDR